MTLQELVDRYRPHLADESVGVRRSWEQMFQYSLRLYPGDTPLEDFDLNLLADRLMAAELHRPIAEGYIKRWRALLDRADAL